AALLAGVAFVIAANVLAAPILLYVAMLLFVLVLLAALVVHVPRRRGTVTRRISPALLTVGAPSQGAVRFGLRWLRIPQCFWHDQLPAAVSGAATGEFPTDNGTHLTYASTGIRRGVWSVGPLTLRTADPFGFAQREQSFDEPRTITIV